MPTSQSKTSPTDRRKICGIPRKVFPLLILLILALAIGGTLYGLRVKHDHAIAADKARFAQAEKEVAELSRSIISTVGEPLKTTHKNFCSRPNLKFEKGPLSCDVDSTLFYKVVNEGGANEIYKQVSTVVTQKWSEIASVNTKQATSFTSLNPADDTSKYQQILKKYETNDFSYGCRVNYVLYQGSKPPYLNYPLSETSEYVLAVKTGCGDMALAQFYPLN